MGNYIKLYNEKVISVQTAKQSQNFDNIIMKFKVKLNVKKFIKFINFDFENEDIMELGMYSLIKILFIFQKIM